jgi:hypothetical protein
MLVKNAKGNGKMNNLQVTMKSIKKLRPQGLGARKPRDRDSLGYYKVEEYQIFIIMWCLPHVLNHLDLALNIVLSGTSAFFREIERLL